jgi:hypothetical protein
MQTAEGKDWNAWDSGKPADWHSVIHGHYDTQQ